MPQQFAELEVSEARRRYFNFASRASPRAANGASAFLLFYWRDEYPAPNRNLLF
jgi:hypothetical protein